MNGTVGVEKHAKADRDAKDSARPVSVEFSNAFSARKTPAFIHAARRNGRLRVWITGVDLSNFESLVGADRAAQHRAAVEVTSADDSTPVRKILARRARGRQAL